MRAIVAESGSTRPRIVDVPEPAEPKAGEVLCRTLQLGVCGTDREILESATPLVPPGEHQLVLGHECLARVTAVGPKVTQVRVGDLVVPVVRRARKGSPPRPDLLPFGDYTERGIVWEHGFSSPVWLDRPEHLFLVPPRLAPIAVLAEPLSVAEKGVNEALALQRGRLGASAWEEPPPRVLVTGMGPIAFAAVIAARCRGWPVALHGRDPEDSFRARLAADLGVDYRSANRFDAEPVNVERDGFDLILECTGNDGMMLHAAGALASCGVMVWLGSSRVPQPAQHNVALLMRNGILRNHLHVGTVNAAPRDFSDALQHLDQLLSSQPRLAQSLITDRVSPTDAIWHYEHRKPQGIKTVVTYE